MNQYFDYVRQLTREKSEAAGPPPNTLHKLVLLAIEDCRSLSRKRFIPDAADWHRPHSSADKTTESCRGCFAGGVISGTMKIPPHTECAAFDFPDAWGYALDALDHVRVGLYPGAYTRLAWAHDRDPDDITDAVYRGLREMDAPRLMHFQGWDEFDDFLLGMDTVAEDLRKLGV